MALLATDKSNVVKIQDPNLTPVSTPTSPAKGVGGSQRLEQLDRAGGGGGRVGKSGDGDSVELSGLSGRLSGLSGGESDGVRAAKLDELQKLLDSDNYTVDSQDLAKRLVDESITG